MTPTWTCALHIAAGSVAVLTALSSTAYAESLPDPTRPPASVLLPASAASAPVDGLQLQSVLLGAGRTPAAVISGEVVLQGGLVRDARLVRVTEHSAVLRGPQGETTLALTPSATKQRTTVSTLESKK
jgi:MSHA biogenesis protein MshK